MLVEMRPIESIRPYENNPRLNDAAVDAVAASIRAFGFRQPIVVDEQGVVIVGHTRYKAALKLGLPEVPVHAAVGLSPAQARAYRIADNQTATLSDWDDDKLPLELAQLQEMAFDLDLTGFSAADLLRLLGSQTNEGQADPDDVPEPPDEPVTRPATCGSWAGTASCAAMRPRPTTWTACSTAPPSTWSTPTRRITSASSRAPTTRSRRASAPSPATATATPAATRSAAPTSRGRPPGRCGPRTARWPTTSSPTRSSTGC